MRSRLCYDNIVIDQRIVQEGNTLKKTMAFAAVLMLAAVLAACGGNDGGNGNASSDIEPTQTLAIEASNWEFDSAEYTIEAGEPVQISLKNAQGFHGIEIVGVGKVEAGKDKVFTLEAGEYKIICSINCGTGHNDMVSKLIVQ